MRGYAPLVRRSLALVTAALILFTGGLVLASCGSGDDDATATTSETTTTTTTATTPKPEGPTVIRITVVDAAAKGGIVRKTVKKGDRVVLVVKSDVTDHIHLHGYDVMRDVAPGKLARLPFKATIPGRFEVELEDRGVPIADITVET